MAKKNRAGIPFSIKSGDESTFDLFMKSPENIKDFTNWEQKTSSLGVDSAKAFEKTPFDPPQRDFFDETEKLTTYDNIEIHGDHAMASLPNYDVMQAGNGSRITGGFRLVIETEIIGGYGSDIVPGPEYSYSAVWIPIRTSIQNKMQLSEIQRQQAIHSKGGCTDVTLRRIKAFVSYEDKNGEIKFIGANGRYINEAAADFAKRAMDLAPTVSYLEGTVYACSSGGGTSLYGAIPHEHSIRPGAITIFGGDAPVAGAGPTNAIYGIGNLDLEETKPTGDGDLQYRIEAPSGEVTSVKIFVEPVQISGLQFTQIQHKGAGRVDHFERRHGNLSANTVGSTDNRVNLGVSDLADGDFIKITSVLEPTATDSINTLNGLYYVKRSDVSNHYELYFDPNLFNRVSIPSSTEYRGLTSATWTLLKSTDNDSPTSNWKYIRSSCGYNQNDDFIPFSNEENPFGVLNRNMTYLELRDSIEGGGFGSTEELLLTGNNYNLGQCISFSDSGLRAFSQPSNHFNKNLDSLRFWTNEPVFDEGFQSTLLGYGSVIGNPIFRAPVNSGFGTNTIRGGMIYDEFNQVIDVDGNPIPIERRVIDVCATVSDAADETTSPDDPTGTTYGEDGIFDTPMSEPVVVDPSADLGTLTGPDNVDYFDYGTDEDGFSDSPDGSAPEASTLADSLDATSTLVHPYGGRPDKNNSGSSRLVNNGCVFVETRYGEPQNRVTVIKASTSNEFISDQPSRFPHLRDIYWHKLYAQHLNLEASIENLRFGNIIYYSPTAFATLTLEAGYATQDIFDLRVKPDVATNWKFNRHPQAAADVRSFYLADFSHVRKFTDGFGISFTFGDDDTLYVADQVSHNATFFSFYTDTMLFDLQDSGYVGGRDARRGERLRAFEQFDPYRLQATTKPQANVLLQHFADAHTKSFGELFANSLGEPYPGDFGSLRLGGEDTIVRAGDTRLINFIFSIHTKKFIRSDWTDFEASAGGIDFNIGDIDEVVEKADELIGTSMQLLPYNTVSLQDPVREVNSAEGSYQDVYLGSYSHSLRGYRVPTVKYSDSKIMTTEHFADVTKTTTDVTLVNFGSRDTEVTEVGPFIKTFSKTDTKTLGLRLNEVIIRDSFLYGWWLHDEYKATRQALEGGEVRYFPTGASLWGGHEYIFGSPIDPPPLKNRENPFATNSITNPQSDLTQYSPIYRIHPFTSDLISGLFANNLKYDQYQRRQIGDFFKWLEFSVDPFADAYEFPRFGENHINVIKTKVPTEIEIKERTSNTTIARIPTTEPWSHLVDEDEKLITRTLRDIDNLTDYNYYSVGYITDPALKEADYVDFDETPRIDARCDEGILGFIAGTTLDEFGLEADFAKRLFLYDVSGANPKFLQRVTAAFPLNEEETVASDSVYNLNESTTEASFTEWFTGFDICKGKVFATTGTHYVILTDTNISPLPRSVAVGEFTEPLFPFFSYTESFSDSSPYNLNNIIEYNRNEGTFIDSFVYDINNSHRSPVLFFSVRQFTKKGQVITVPTKIDFNVDVSSNTSVNSIITGADSPTFLPRIGIYKQDPRLSIEQRGQVVGSDLLFGQDSITGVTPLYGNSVQNPPILATPSYRFTGGKFIGTFSTEQNGFNHSAASLRAPYKHLSSEDNRTFRYNDGNGNALTNELDSFGERIPASYQLEFDDINKETYNGSFFRGGSCIIVSLLSWGDEYRPRPGEENVEPYRQPYTKYDFNEENPHSYLNSARISAEVSYKEYDLARFRRFACNGNWYDVGDVAPLVDGEANPLIDITEHSLSTETPSLELYGEDALGFFNGPDISGVPRDIIMTEKRDPYLSAAGLLPPYGTYTPEARARLVRAATSKAQPHFNEHDQVLLGTESDSIQVISPELTFDMPKPDFLPLMINSIPTENNDADLFTRGHIVSTGNVDLHISGVRFAYNFATLHLGEVKVDNDFDISIPEVIGFECDGVSLALLPPTGTHEEATSPLVFPGGTGVQNDLSLSINPTVTSGAFDFYVQGGLGSGNMDVAISGVHGVSNSMPCVEGNLFIGAMTGPSSGIMPLHINRFTESGVMPLFMEPGNSSGIMPLSINTQPIHSSGILFSRGHQSDDFETTLFIGRQFDEKRMDLSVSGPVEFNGDMTLHASGAVIPTANSLTNNYSHSCELLKTENKFDLSPSSEKLIPLTKANSISRNTHLPSSNFKYGYYAPSQVGKRFDNYRNDSAAVFYDSELSREVTASNENYLAIGTNASILSPSNTGLQVFEYSDEDSLSLKFTYDRFMIDMQDLGLLGDQDYGFRVRYKSVDISANNRIAVSVRYQTQNGLRDAVFILQPATLTRTRYGVEEYDLCAIEPDITVSSTTENIDGWIMTHAVLGDLIDTTSVLSKVNNYMGNTVQWKDEDLYYDKQAKDFGEVRNLTLSDNYATENLAFSFRTLADGLRYKDNRYSLPEGTKVGFGSRFKIDGDYAVVSAPLLDTHVVNTDLSAIHANAPEGAVYVYKYSSGWSHIETLYAGGYFPSNISGTSDCAYSYKLFGYNVDLNKDSKYIAVSEPGTNTIYKYIIHDNDTVSSIDSYTDDTSARFGNSLNLCSNSILTNDIQFIKDPVHDYSFAFTPQENVQEVEQYNPSSSSTISVSSQFTFVKMIKPFGVPKLLAGRTFRVRFAAQPELIIEKISILDIRQNSGNLFISGPILSNSEQDLLYYRPFESGTNDMSLQFASIGVNSGIPLHVHVPDPASGDMSLHLRQAEKFETTLFIGAEFTDNTFASDLSISGPIASTLEKDLFAGGVELEANDRDLYILGGLAAQRGQDMFIKQDDLISASGANELFLEGIYGGTGNIVKTSTLYLGAGNFGPASGISTLALKTDEFGRASGITTLAIAQDPASGVFDGTFATSVGGSGVSDTTGFFRENGTANLIIAATAPASGINTLYLHRKGVGGGEELDANSNLIVYNLTEASNVNLAVSGANIATADMNIAISGVVGLGTGIMPAFVRGYQD